MNGLPNTDQSSITLQPVIADVCYFLASSASFDCYSDADITLSTSVAISRILLRSRLQLFRSTFMQMSCEDYGTSRSNL